MCIFQARCKILEKRSITVLELIIVLVIISIISSVCFVTWLAQLEKEYADNARITLRMLWQAEEDYFVWKNAYTSDWALLEIDNPNLSDKFYAYAITQASGRNLLIQATLRTRPSKHFTINQDGVITE